jgi:VanZ family protein
LSASGSTKRWIALLAWIAVIFIFSTDSFSSSDTSRIIVPVLKFLFPFLSPEQLSLGHAVCRKAGHVLEYFVLGVMVWRALNPDRASQASQAPWKKARLLAVGLVLAVALSDEFHQAFVPSRTSALTDVGYDVIGGMVALMLMSRFRNEPRTLHSHPVL